MAWFKECLYRRKCDSLRGWWRSRRMLTFLCLTYRLSARGCRRKTTGVFDCLPPYWNFLYSQQASNEWSEMMWTRLTTTGVQRRRDLLSAWTMPCVRDAMKDETCRFDHGSLRVVEPRLYALHPTAHSPCLSWNRTCRRSLETYTRRTMRYMMHCSSKPRTHRLGSGFCIRQRQVIIVIRYL